VNLDEHVRAKDAGLHRDAFGFQQFDQAADERLGHVGRRGISVTGAAAFARVAVQRELTDDEHAPAHIQHRAVELAFVVVKDTQRGDLAGHPLRFSFRVARAHADEDCQPALNRAGYAPFHGH